MFGNRRLRRHMQLQISAAFLFILVIACSVSHTYQSEDDDDSSARKMGHGDEGSVILEAENTLEYDADARSKSDRMILPPPIKDGDENDDPIVKIENTDDNKNGVGVTVSDIPVLHGNNATTIGGVGHTNDTKPLKTIAACAIPQHMTAEAQVVNDGESEIPGLPQHESSTEEPQETGPSGIVTDGANSVENPDVTLEETRPLTPPTVELVNVTQLIQDVLWSNTSIKSRGALANCSIVLFYASWCPFSAKAAPHFNALPRAFPALRVAAIEASSHTSVNSYFGILSVPTILLFHNGKSIAKFNESSFTLNKIAEFIQTHTDLRSDANINVTSNDFAGPLSSNPKQVIDYYLILAWIFITVCFFYYITKSALWRKAIDLIRTTWREAEDHVHQD